MMEGRYGINVYSDEAVFEVRQGHAEIAFEASTGQLPSGKAMIVRKSTAGIHFETVELAPPTELDKWVAARDKNLRRVVSLKYLSRDIYGAQDLDAHGRWRYVDGYGHCWFPDASRSWVPYRNGHWMWIDYYGWNWVGSEPWGWAPYHWGRWYRHPSFGWGWFPGSPRLRHTWRPALVAFFGYSATTPGRVLTSSIYGGIGWVPLAPGERFVPWYGQRYYSGNNTIVLDNSVQIINNYRNARNSQGLSYVESRDLGNSLRQTPRAIRTGEFQEATAIRGPLPVVPYRASQGQIVVASGSDRAAALLNQRRAAVTALRDGTARVPFDAQQERVRRSVETYRSGTASPAGRVAASAAASASVGGRTGTVGVGTARDPSVRSAAASETRMPTAGSTSAPRPGTLSTTRGTRSATAPATATRAPVSGRTRATVSRTARDGSIPEPTAAPVAPPARSTSVTTARVPTSRSSSSQSQVGSRTSSPVFMPRTRSRLATRSPASGSSPSGSRVGTRSSSPSYSQRTRSQGTTRFPSYGSSSSRSSSPSYGSSSSRRSSPSYGSSSSRSSSPSYRSSPSYGSSSSRSSSPSYGSSSRSSSPSYSSSRSSSSSSRSSSSSSSSRSSSSPSSSSSRSSTSSSRSPSR